MRVCLLNLSFQAETRTVSNLLYVTFNHEMFYSKGRGLAPGALRFLFATWQDVLN